MLEITAYAASGLVATHLRDNRWAVRPAGCLGTCGWKDGKAWSVVYVNAKSAEAAIKKASQQSRCRGRLVSVN